MAEGFNTDGMLEMFLYESEQLLENLQNIVLERKDETAFSEDDINEIFRTMHTIKGSSGIMMYENITHISHKLEDLFYYLRESKPKNVPHLELVEKVLEVADFITAELDKIKAGEEPDGDENKLLKELDEFLGRIKGEIKEQGKELPKENKQEEPIQFYIAPVEKQNNNYYRVAVYYESDTQMSNIRAYSATHALKEAGANLQYSPEDIITNEDSADVILEEGFHMLIETTSDKEEVRKLVDGCGAERIELVEITKEEFKKGFKKDEEVSKQPETAELLVEIDKKKELAPGDFVVKAKETGKAKTLAKSSQNKASIISVSVEKMDVLMDLIGEIVIAEAVVLQNPDLKVPGLDLTNFQKAAAQLSKITTELQEAIMSMRMMPLTNTFQKMKRIVFDVSRKLGKDIDMEMIGENTEVDKNIIESISDPLMHLVRNAIDHGIEEDAASRVDLGKSPAGKITLEAKNEGGKVYVTVRDDGKGLNKEKLYQKAKKNGLVGNKEMSEFTDKEIYRFITLPGFSTKEVVTEYSGRGVGMDVVVKNIQKIGGRLEIDSKEGFGSEMTLVIPLTLAIINGIVVKVGNSSFVLETSSIKEFVRVGEEKIVADPSGDDFVVLRGEVYPFIRLSERYHIESSPEKLENRIIVVLEHEGKRVCVLIDELIQEQEIVVKPIPAYIGKVQGLSGCTQLGDGTIALILDIAGLIMEDTERS